MSDDTVIRVENLGKEIIAHQREHYTALRDVLADGVKSGTPVADAFGKGSLPQPMKSSGR